MFQNYSYTGIESIERAHKGRTPARTLSEEWHLLAKSPILLITTKIRPLLHLIKRKDTALKKYLSLHSNKTKGRHELPDRSVHSILLSSVSVQYSFSSIVSIARSPGELIDTVTIFSASSPFILALLIEGGLATSVQNISLETQTLLV